jgi:hypothetical protein
MFTTWTGEIGAGALCRICWTAAGASGRPGFWASVDCCRAKGTGGGGGAVRATTCRLNTLAGGRGALDEAPALGPRTLACCGAIAGAAAKWAEASWEAGTTRALWATERPLANVFCGTAVTAFGTFWFTYFTLVMVLLEFLLSL